MKKKPEEKPVADEVIEVKEEPATAQEIVKEPTRPVTRRFSKRGKRRGKYAYAAPLGVLISLLAVVGVAALVFGGIAGIQKLTDTTALEEEFYYFLEPVMAYNPTPFEDINTAEEQDAFLHAAAYRISLNEQLRMLLEKDESSLYSVDDTGRIVVSAEEMAESYAALFGANAPLTHRTLSEDTVTYSETDGCYYVPFDSLNSGYEGVVESVKRRSGDYVVRIAYVSINDIRLDEHGNTLDPDPADATLFQTYTLGENEDGTYYVKSCANE